MLDQQATNAEQEKRDKVAAAKKIMDQIRKRIADSRSSHDLLRHDERRRYSAPVARKNKSFSHGHGEGKILQRERSMKQLVEIENTKRRAIILAALTEYVPPGLRDEKPEKLVVTDNEIKNYILSVSVLTN